MLRLSARLPVKTLWVGQCTRPTSLCTSGLHTHVCFRTSSGSCGQVRHLHQALVLGHLPRPQLVEHIVEHAVGVGGMIQEGKQGLASLAWFVGAGGAFGACLHHKVVREKEEDALVSGFAVTEGDGLVFAGLQRAKRQHGHLVQLVPLQVVPRAVCQLPDATCTNATQPKHAMNVSSLTREHSVAQKPVGPRRPMHSDPPLKKPPMHVRLNIPAER
jgi:hypothetical protein